MRVLNRRSLPRRKAEAAAKGGLQKEKSDAKVELMDLGRIRTRFKGNW